MQSSGLYQQGTSLFHRLDARFKLLLLLLLIVSLFAAPGPYRLLLLAIIGVSATLACRVSLWQVLQKLLILRWLLLFGLLLHLLFTPGRTLLGTSWLSYDGLLRGLQVDLQLLLAMLFAYLLALTTSPTDLAGGLVRLLSPLQRLGVPTREVGGLLLLVLHFLPLLREETLKLKRQERPIGLMNRLRAVIGLVGPLLLALVERADSLAYDLVGKGSSLEPADDEMSQSDHRLDRWVLFWCLPLFVLLWVL